MNLTFVKPEDVEGKVLFITDPDLNTHHDQLRNMAKKIETELKLKSVIILGKAEVTFLNAGEIKTFSANISFAEALKQL